MVEELGKVCMYVDETTTSVHRGTNDRTGRPVQPYKLNTDGTVRHKVWGTTPKIYKKGNHCFTPPDALDFVRQRDLLAARDYDYGRQRHQQQFLRAVLKQAFDSGLGSPQKLPGLLSAVGKTMTVDDGGIPLEDWVFAMRGLNPDDLVALKNSGIEMIFIGRRRPGQPGQPDHPAAAREPCPGGDPAGGGGAGGLIRGIITGCTPRTSRSRDSTARFATASARP